MSSVPWRTSCGRRDRPHEVIPPGGHRLDLGNALGSHHAGDHGGGGKQHADRPHHHARHLRRQQLQPIAVVPGKPLGDELVAVRRAAHPERVEVELGPGGSPAGRPLPQPGRRVTLVPPATATVPAR